MSQEQLINKQNIYKYPNIQINMDRDIRYSTIKKVSRYLKEQNKPVNKSKIHKDTQTDYNSVKKALNILYEENKIDLVGKNIHKEIILK